MKLAKLPDRTPVKMNVALTPGLAQRLREYAAFYAETYGNKEEVAELIPFMLEAFLDGDADFRRACRAGGVKDTADAAPRIAEDRWTRKGQDHGGESSRKD
ncbi:DUF2274 domain-containing protein [Bradyrhizobium sp. 170]|uniref:DUF2274 domain-containing protein n=1 Tax=Bradyrhizobium sp. 170 TaxID=2782641 RepID=UPI0020005A9E|nr:DUF2274 domain-containing protein [Bradyrhizobium sp. 170]UPK05912.1 DUF2274 domain-containing protein [Bradyrhizobium sp. 170]